MGDSEIQDEEGGGVEDEDLEEEGAGACTVDGCQGPYCNHAALSEEGGFKE